MRPEANDIRKQRIQAKIESIAGYSISILRKRIKLNAYDALMVLKEIRGMESENFFNQQFAISPYDFKRKHKA